MTDSIFNKDDNSLEPNTYKRVIQRIYICFCTSHIEEYIIHCGITPFDLLTPLDDRDIYLDINILLYTKDSFTNPPHPNSRLLISTTPQAIIQYKQELMKRFLQHDFFNKMNNIHKIDNW